MSPYGSQKVEKGQCEPKPCWKKTNKKHNFLHKCNMRHCRAFVIGTRDGMPVEMPPRKVRKTGGWGSGWKAGEGTERPCFLGIDAAAESADGGPDNVSRHYHGQCPVKYPCLLVP